VTQVRTPHDWYADINWWEIWQFGNLSKLCFVFVSAFCLSSSCVSSAQCCQCLWLVNFWLPLRFFLTFIGNREFWQFWNGWYVDMWEADIWQFWNRFHADIGGRVMLQTFFNHIDCLPSLQEGCSYTIKCQYESWLVDLLNMYTTVVTIDLQEYAQLHGDCDSTWYHS
jgi:hypothetical protein